MKLKQLLNELERLTHAGRMARLVDIGRQSRTDAKLAELLDAMEQGDGYQRRLAMQSCYGSRDSARVLRGLNDASRLVRNLAISLIALACDDEQVLGVLTGLSPRPRRSLLRRLAKLNRYAPIDAYLEAAAARGELGLEPLAAFSSPEGALRLWPHLSERAAPSDWYRLARRHPQITLGFLRGELAKLPTDLDLSGVALQRANVVVNGLVLPAPQLALDLLRELLERAPLKQVSWQVLIQRLPQDVVTLLLGSNDDLAGMTHHLGPVLHRLDEATLLRTLTHCPQLLAQLVRNPDWMRKIGADRRSAIHAAFTAGWQDGDGLIPESAIGLLPRIQRETEARRLWNLPLLATRPQQRLPYSSYLPWDETLDATKAFLNNPDPQLRILALNSLISGVRYHREKANEILEMVRQRGNEQDPVRMSMLSGLAGLPPITWQREHLGVLGEIIRQALEAADLSMGTAAAAERLIVQAIPRHPEWAVGWMSTIVKERGYLSFYGLESRLSDDNVRGLAPLLAPVFRSWQVREREAQFIGAVRALGRRARVFPQLDEMLQQTAREGSQFAAGSALNLLREHFRPQFAAFVPQLLRKDPSWATQQMVYEFLHRKRQDLITDYLGRAAYKGKFSTGRTRFVLPLRDGFERWLPEQQQLFAETLAEVVLDTDRDTPAKLFCVMRMAALPDAPSPLLWSVARRQSDKNLALRDTALRALAHLDAGQGVDELISALGDARARIAIYALRAALLEMPDERAVEILRAAPTQKVTVAKEILRLLGDLKCSAALDLLLEWVTQDLHRDVRVALLRALWEHLDDERSWVILQDAARSDDAAIATMATRTTAERLSAAAQRNLAQLLANLAGHDDATVRLSVLQRCQSQPIADPEQALRTPLFAALASDLPDEFQSAAQAVFAIYPHEGSLIAEAVRHLMPRRQALSTVLPLFLAALRLNAKLRGAGREIVAVLGDDMLCTQWRVRVAMHSLPTEEIVALLEELADSDLLHADNLRAACDEIARQKPVVPAMWQSFFGLLDEGEPIMRQPEALESLLSGHADERLRRLALAALCAAARGGKGWTPELRTCLLAYQNDSSPLVAGAAQFIFVPEETE